VHRGDEVIVAKDVWYKYPNGHTALRGVSLRIAQGDAVAIVGANGSGKTTLIKHFNGLLKPSRGKVLVLGKDTRNASVAELARRVGIVFQNPLNQFFRDSVEAEVAFALENFMGKVDPERIRSVLGELGIEHLRRKSPFEISLGEQRRVALASVLVYEPEILVLDEPTAGLDYNSKMKLLGILKRLHEEGRTLIVASHDIEFLARMPLNRVVVLGNGRVVFDGSPKEAFYNVPLLLSSRLVPPQMPELIIRLGLERLFNPLSEDEAYDLLRSLIGGSFLACGGS